MNAGGEFFHANWKVLLLMTGLSALLLWLPFQCISLAQKRSDEYSMLVSRGKRISGRIVKHEMFREVYASKYGIRGREGIQVLIEYADGTGEVRKLSETWPTHGNLNPEDQTGKQVMLYYLEENDLVKVTSGNDPEIRAAMRLLREKVQTHSSKQSVPMLTRSG